MSAAALIIRFNLLGDDEGRFEGHLEHVERELADAGDEGRSLSQSVPESRLGSEPPPSYLDTNRRLLYRSPVELKAASGGCLPWGRAGGTP